MNNDTEDKLIASLDDQKLYELFMPAIKQVIKSGGGADAILKNSEALAATKMASAVFSEKAEVSLKAAIEILNRVQGKPVERHLNIYADVARMSEEQLDQEIMQLAKRAGVKNVIDIVTAPAPKALPGKPGRPHSRKRI